MQSYRVVISLLHPWKMELWNWTMKNFFYSAKMETRIDNPHTALHNGQTAQPHRNLFSHELWSGANVLYLSTHSHTVHSPFVRKIFFTTPTSRWKKPSLNLPKNRALIPPPPHHHLWPVIKPKERRSSQNFSTPSNCITEKFTTRVSATSIPRLD